MKLLIEVTPNLLERVRRAAERGGYPSLAEFAILAIENQLGLEGGAHVSEPPRSDPSGDETGPKHGGRATPIFFPQAQASTLEVSEAGWLWGIINRVLPIKFAARTLLLTGPTRLSSFRNDAAEKAAAFAQELLKETGHRGREESLAIGFPVRQPMYPAKLRFANHYVGRMEGKGTPRGALFELGLAGSEGAKGDAVIGLTELGYEFASLQNPAIDLDDFSVGISERESRFYVQRIAKTIPREADCFSTLLEALTSGALSIDALNERVNQHLPQSYSPAAMQAQKAGAIGRVRDLGLAKRVKSKTATRFELTARGADALEALHGAATSTASAASAGQRQ